MWHIYRSASDPRLFEIAFIKGRYIVGSKQGYARKKAACRAIAIVGSSDKMLKAQDDTGERPILVFVHHDGSTTPVKNGTVGKKYRPKVI